ncbi:MAG: flavin-containing monooxygenase [Planctomycetota bacterium]|jgi:dimethylaniline monooxygenase (N-oxide forming)
MDFSHVTRIGIIGAGEAGISTAKMLLAAGYRCTIFERNDRIGGVWTTGYLDFGIQVQRELYEIPDWPQPFEAPDFTPGPQICAYLEDYANHFGVTPHVRFGTTVVGLRERTDGSPGWTLSYRGVDGAEDSEDFDLVVVAIGVYSHTPHMPDFADRQRFNGRVIHNSQLQSRDHLRGKKVVVIGYGKSATDAAILAADHSDEATLVFREAHWPIPAVLLGGIPFKYALFNRFTNAMLPLHVRARRWVRAWHRVGKPFIWAFWRLIERVLMWQCGLKRRSRGNSATRANLMPSQRIEFDGFSNSTMLPKPEFFRYIHSGKLGAERAEIAAYTEDGVLLTNGRKIECDTVILGTGWQTDYEFLAKQILRRINIEDDGYYLYRQAVHPDVPNLAFIGSNATTYINILTHNIQARWLTELIRGTHELPERSVMLTEIETTKAWKRRIVPPGKDRAATLHLHMQQYHDELLSDMGVSPHRKRGVFGFIKEIFAPYQPSDYASVASGEAIRVGGRWPRNSTGTRELSMANNASGPVTVSKWRHLPVPAGSEESPVST